MAIQHRAERVQRASERFVRGNYRKGLAGPPDSRERDWTLDLHQ